jgi:hypothetical protein
LARAFLRRDCLAVILHSLFAVLGMTPESSRVVGEVTRFAIDYTFWLNLAMAVVAAVMVWLHRTHMREHVGDHHYGESGIGIKRVVVYVMIAGIALGLVFRVASGV